MIELLDDFGPDDADDVAFGVRGRRGERGRSRGDASDDPAGDGPSSAGRRKGGLIAGGTIIGLIAVAGVVGATRDDASAPTSTAPVTTIARPTTTPAEVTTTIDGFFDTEPTDAPAVTEPPAPTVVDVGAEPLDTGGLPLGVFISEGGSESRRVHRIDLLTGLVSDFGNVINQDFMVIATATGPALVDGRGATGIWGAVPGPPGTFWSIGDGGQVPAYRLVDASTKDVLRTVPAGGGGFGGGLLGSMDDGRPVVIGADFRPYVINPDDSFSRLADNSVTSWQRGGVVETRCSEAMACAMWVRTAIGEVDLGPDALANNPRVMISGDGRVALMFPDGRPMQVDIATATTTPLFADDSVTSYEYASGFFGESGATDPWFGPDDRYVAFTSAEERILVIWDTATSTARTWQLPIDWERTRVLGIA